MRTRLFCLTLCLAVALAALPFALGEEDAQAQTRRLRLGSSIYTIEIDGSFKYGPVTEADAADGQVAYLYSDAMAVDFDIYQTGVAGGQLSLSEYVTEEAAARGDAGGIVTDGEINGIPVGWYRRVETWNGVEYLTLTYVLDDGEGFVEVVFWLDGEDAEAVAQGMMDTLAVDNLAPVRLGDTSYYLFCSASFHEGGMTSADVAEGQVAYWLSEETLLDFDVYQHSKAGLPERLSDYVAREAAAYHADAVETDAQINGIPVGWYRTVESWEGEDYETLTCALDAGDDYIVIVFWLDGLTAEAEADAILQSLWRDDSPEADEGAQAEGAEAASADTRTIRLGSSPFTLAVPAGFVEGEMTQEDIEDDQVAYWYSNDTLLDFDVYQFGKDGYPDALAVYVEDEISGYNEVTELVKDGEINGIPAAWYRTVEEYQDVTFDTITYILDGGNEYVEVVFWLDGDIAEAEAIIRTVNRDDGDMAADGEDAVLVEAEAEIATARRTSGEEPGAGEAPLEDAIPSNAPEDGTDAIGVGE